MAGIEQRRRLRNIGVMERIVRLHIEKLPEGVYLATSDEVPGLVAQGRTVTETLEIARDVARRLIEEQGTESASGSLPVPADAFDYPLVIAA
jgi:predicted RNase H-like HicB family nuclease